MGSRNPRRRPLIPGMQSMKRGRPKRRLFTIYELAEYLSVSRGTVYTLMSSGLPSYRVAAGSTGGIRFDLPRVLDWLEAQRERRRAEGWE